MDYYSQVVNKSDCVCRPLLPATEADAEIERLMLENRRLQSDLAAALNMVSILKAVVKEHQELFKACTGRKG